MVSGENKFSDKIAFEYHIKICSRSHTAPTEPQLSNFMSYYQKIFAGIPQLKFDIKCLHFKLELNNFFWCKFSSAKLTFSHCRLSNIRPPKTFLSRIACPKGSAHGSGINASLERSSSPRQSQIPYIRRHGSGRIAETHSSGARRFTG